MQLKSLASKPQLTQITLTDKALVEKYGDEIQFHIYDRLPVETYTKLATVNHTDAAEMYNLVKDLILDESGNPIVTEDFTLPTDVLTAAIVKVTEELGK